MAMVPTNVSLPEVIIFIVRLNLVSLIYFVVFNIFGGGKEI